MALIDDNAKKPADTGPDSEMGEAAPGGPPSQQDDGAAPMDKNAETKKDISAVSSSETQTADGSFTIDVAQVRAKMQIPPQFQDAYQRVVTAGSRILFNPQTHALVMQHLDGQGGIAARLGRGIAGLMLMVLRKSNYKAPAQVLVPAGVDLLVQACDYLLKAKTVPLKPQDVADATRVLIATLLVQFGGAPDKVKQQLGVDGTAGSSGEQIDRNADPDAGGPGGTDEEEAQEDAANAPSQQPLDQQVQAAAAQRMPPAPGLVNGQQ